MYIFTKLSSFWSTVFYFVIKYSGRNWKGQQFKTRVSLNKMFVKWAKNVFKRFQMVKKLNSLKNYMI